MSTLRIATRGSDLALAQANYIAGRARTELARWMELHGFENEEGVPTEEPPVTVAASG